MSYFLAGMCKAWGGMATILIAGANGFVGWLEEQFTTLGKTRDVASELARHLQGRMQGIALLGAACSDTEFITREVRQLTHWLEEL